MADLCRVQSEPLGMDLPVDAALAAVMRRPLPAILDSADAGPGRGRYTILTCEPIQSLSWSLGGDDPFLGMRHCMREMTPQTILMDSVRPFFCGGWIGYFAYEAGRYIEKLPATTLADLEMPVARFGLYDSAAIHDAATGQWTLVAVDLPGYDLPPAEIRIRRRREMLADARSPSIAPPEPADEVRHNMSHEQYLTMVRRAIEYIAAGDIFQVNLARRESHRLARSAAEVYLNLRSVNPGAYAAYLAWPGKDGEQAILSASPELFLQMDGREVLTRPIKGTRPRGGDPESDCEYQLALARSEKDRAELAMIVDLLRNDLGRVCEFGSIQVLGSMHSPAAPYALETHPTVHHLVADIVGKLRPDCDAIDLLRATFPGGSITGAPKVRAMEIIDELEPTQRGVYTGAVGYFGLDGRCAFNIPIRTLVRDRGWYHVYSGGGIVADSDPQDEYRETQAKICGLTRALGVQQPSTILL